MSLLINHYYRFAAFTLDTDQRVLVFEGKTLALAPKIFETLLILVENRGRILTRDELMTRLWPDTFVEEANLTFNIQQLRKSLGDNAREPIYIETIPRRGYRFVAPVEEVLSESGAASDRITGRFETYDLQLPDAAGELKSDTEAQKPEVAAKLAHERHAVLPEKNLEARSASRAASTMVSKRTIALAAALVMLLAGIGLVFWKFANSSNNDSNESRRAGGKFVAATPLKFEKLTLTGQSPGVAISPDGKYIAYTRNFEKKSSIWLRQLATNINVEIVPASGIIYGLGFTNSGDSLYFVRGDPTALYRVSLLGGVPTKIVDNLEGFSVSTDDSQIAFIRETVNRDGEREYSLMIANSDGAGQRTLLVGTHPDDLDAPVWTPDSRSIICASGSSHGGGQNVSLIEVRVADGMKKELSTHRFFRIRKIAWLTDKSGLVMVARERNEDNNQLWRVTYPGMEISQITEGMPAFLDLSVASGMDKAVASQATRLSDIWIGSRSEARSLKKITQATDYFCWTPDGRLVYESTASGNGDLWIMHPDGTEQKQLTVNARANATPAVTPDNRYIVFTSNRTGSSQVWRMNLDGSNQIQLTDGAEKSSPSISPDGKWILYNTTDDWHLWKVSIDGGEPIRLTKYFATWPSVSPDGKMIACMGRNESKRELLVLSFEGGQPLKEIDFALGDFSMYRIQWTPDGKALIYSTERNGAMAIMKQSLDGSPPEEIVDFAKDELSDFGYSVDGKYLAVTRCEWESDIVLIGDLNRY